MRIPRMLRAGALIAAAVVLGLLAVQGTYALWNASTSAAPGTVTSASFDVSLTASPSGQATNMSLPGGTSATVSLGSVASLAPGTPVYASLVVGNNSNAGGTFSTSITAGQATVTNAGLGILAQYVTVSAKFASAIAECNTATGYTPLTAAGLTSAAVPKAASTVLCFQVSLSSSTSMLLKGQAVNISLPLTARQLCGVPSGCA
jgi:predicted ribosomally synthesized peptide with SipW-like signal peptide